MNPSLSRLVLVVLVVLAGTAWTVSAYLDALHADPLGSSEPVATEPRAEPGNAERDTEAIADAIAGEDDLARAPMDRR